MVVKQVSFGFFRPVKVIGAGGLTVLSLVIFIACYHYSTPTQHRFSSGKEIFVRVRLSVGCYSVKLKGAQGLLIMTNNLRYEVAPEKAVVLDQEDNRIAVKLIEGRSYRGVPTLWQSTNDTVFFFSTGLIEVEGRRYRGEVRAFIVPDTGMVVVNKLTLEQYLYGVVPAEIGPIKPETFEAVKAQAVAARSFTLSRLKMRRGLGYELYDSYLRDQEYQGADREVGLGNKAVDETKGEVLMFNDEVAVALYHGNCGGVTADGSEPYLRSVYDTPGNRAGAQPFCASSPNYYWRRSVSQDSVELVLMQLKGWKDKPKVLGFRLEKDRLNKRVTRVRFQTDRGEVAVGGSQFRLALGLKSTYFQMKLSARRFTFEGRGWGHGVGLCQDGAIAMALKGYHYRQILSHYYPALRIKKVY